MNFPPVVVLASHSIGLGTIRCLGKKGVPVIVVYYNKFDMGYVSKYVKKAYKAPHPEQFEDEFLDILKRVGSEFSGSMLLPSDDHTLVVTSKHKSLLSEYFVVECPDWSVTQKFINKIETYRIAEKVGVPSPRTLFFRTLEEIESQLDQIQFPCILKPCVGHLYFDQFKRKMIMVHSVDELRKEFEACCQCCLEMMIQEYIPGDDTHGVNYNAYVDETGVLVDFTAEKVRLSPPGFGVPRVLISKDIPELRAMGRKVLSALGYSGYACTEFKRDARNGRYVFMEVNGRVNLSILHAWACGINFPWIVYQDRMFHEKPSPVEFEKGIYWIDSVKDVITSFAEHRNEKHSLKSYLKPYFSRKQFAIIDFTDPLPFFKRVFDISRMGVDRIIGK